MRKKQLIVLLDGTWNEPQDDDANGSSTRNGSHCPTNIVRLRELIDQYLTGNEPEGGGRDGRFSRGPRHRYDCLVFYEKGVGTNFRDRFAGGVFGVGVSENIRRAYRFLAKNYTANDDIFVFGFSRGAYTARSLLGILKEPGLLYRDSCNAELEARIWRYYGTAPNSRSPAEYDALLEFVHDPETVSISCIGVFDTVGALGVPLEDFRTFNRDIVQFHDVSVSGIAQVNLHALAIDEHREPFRATNWTKPKFLKLRDELRIEQIWFSGAHGNVGGGYIKSSERKVAGCYQQHLDDVSLDWMVRRVKHYFPEFPVAFDENEFPCYADRGPQEREDQEDSRDAARRRDEAGAGYARAAPQHETRGWLYCSRPYINRSINNVSLALPQPLFATFFPGLRKEWDAYPNQSLAVDEAVHISALTRYGEKIKIDGLDHIYRPLSLRIVLPIIASTYKVEAPKIVRQRPENGKSIHIVDWSGFYLFSDRFNNQRVIDDLVDRSADARREAKDRVEKLLFSRALLRLDFIEACESSGEQGTLRVLEDGNRFELTYNANCPFGASVRLAAQILGVADRLEIVSGTQEGVAPPSACPMPPIKDFAFSHYPSPQAADGSTVYNCWEALEYMHFLTRGGWRRILPPGGEPLYRAIGEYEKAAGICRVLTEFDLFELMATGSSERIAAVAASAQRCARSDMCEIPANLKGAANFLDADPEPAERRRILADALRLKDEDALWRLMDIRASAEPKNLQSQIKSIWKEVIERNLAWVASALDALNASPPVGRVHVGHIMTASAISALEVRFGPSWAQQRHNLLRWIIELRRSYPAFAMLDARTQEKRADRIPTKAEAEMAAKAKLAAMSVVPSV